MLFWRSFSHWIGGMGILVFMLAIVRMDGGQAIHLLRAESPGPTVSRWCRGWPIRPRSSTGSILPDGVQILFLSGRRRAAA